MPEISNEIKLFTNKRSFEESSVPLEQGELSKARSLEKPVAYNEVQYEIIQKPHPQSMISPKVNFLSLQRDTPS